MSGVDGVSILNMAMGEQEIVSTLNVTTTAPSNSGEYTCLANNGVKGRGYVNRTSAILIVYGEWRTGGMGAGVRRQSTRQGTG